MIRQSSTACDGGFGGGGMAHQFGGSGGYTGGHGGMRGECFGGGSGSFNAHENGTCLVRNEGPGNVQFDLYFNRL